MGGEVVRAGGMFWVESRFGALSWSNKMWVPLLVHYCCISSQEEAPCVLR